MSISAVTSVTFKCDCCGEQETRREREGYETSSGETPPDGWRYFRAAFTWNGSHTDLFLLCLNCSSRVSRALGDLKNASGKTIC